MNNAAAVISALGLSPHPEGGWFLETYRCAETTAAEALPERYGGPRSFSTAIYYLLEQGDYSALHRVRTDELFHFYFGAPVEILTVSPKGVAEIAVIGADIAAGQRPQFLVPGGTIQALRPAVQGGAYSLLGTTVAPGFDYRDFALLSADAVFDQFPQLKTSPTAPIIRSLSPRS